MVAPGTSRGRSLSADVSSGSPSIAAWRRATIRLGDPSMWGRIVARLQAAIEGEPDDTSALSERPRLVPGATT